MPNFSADEVRNIIREELEPVFQRLRDLEARLDLEREQAEKYVCDESTRILSEELKNCHTHEEIKEAFQRHNARMMALEQDKFRECMRRGIKTNAYVYKNKLMRHGSVYAGNFYFNWGYQIRCIPVNHVEVIGTKSSE